MRLARPLIALTLLGCASAPQIAGPARADHADALRNCATVTQHCRGVAALVPAMPGTCRAAPQAGCLLSTASGRETLGALDMPDGTVCGFRRIEGSGQVWAILGRIERSADGTVQYASARFPRDGRELARITSVRQLATACATLN